MTNATSSMLSPPSFTVSAGQILVAVTTADKFIWVAPHASPTARSISGQRVIFYPLDAITAPMLKDWLKENMPPEVMFFFREHTVQFTNEGDATLAYMTFRG